MEVKEEASGGKVMSGLLYSDPKPMTMFTAAMTQLKASL